MKVSSVIKSLLLGAASTCVAWSGLATASSTEIVSDRPSFQPMAAPPLALRGTSTRPIPAFTVQVDRELYFEELDLRDLLNLSRHRGTELRSLELEIYADPGARVLLLADRREMAVSTSAVGVTNLVPRRTLTIDKNVFNLDLRVEGRVFVRQITAHFRRATPIPSRTFYVLVPVNQNLRSGDSADLSSRVDLSRYLGYRLVAIDVVGAPAMSDATLGFRVDRSVQGSVVVLSRNEPGILTLDSPVVIHGGENLELFTQDDVLVDSVTLKFLRR